jgi:hypothetical protein
LGQVIAMTRVAGSIRRRSSLRIGARRKMMSDECRFVKKVAQAYELRHFRS